MPSRRSFLTQIARGAAVAGGAGAAGRAFATEQKGEALRRRSGSQRRWRTAFGLNGFMSSEREFGNSRIVCQA